MKKIGLIFTFMCGMVLARSANDAYRMPASGNRPGWGTLAMGGGGTGQTGFANKCVVYSNGTLLTCDVSRFLFDTSTNILGVNSYLQLGVGTGAVLGGFGLSTKSLVIGNNLNVGGLPIVVSATPSAEGLVVVRGGGSSTPASTSCGTAKGEGYTCTRSTTGTYSITWSTAFSDVPVCVCGTVDSSPPPICTAAFSNTSAGVFVIRDSASTLVDKAWSFICMGQR